MKNKNRCLSDCKRGNLLAELLTITIFIAIFTVFFVGIYMAQSQINNLFQGMTGLTNHSKMIEGDLTNNFPSIGDNMITFVFIGLWLVAIVGAFIVDTHPIFLIVSVILLAVYVMIGAVISNFIMDFQTNNLVSTYAAQFPMTFMIFKHYVAWVIAIGVSLCIVLYGKNSAFGK